MATRSKLPKSEPKQAKSQLHEAVEMVRAAGYKVRPNHTYKKHTFECEVQTLSKFFKLQESLDIKVKDAISEALTDWIDKRSQRQ